MNKPASPSLLGHRTKRVLALSLTLGLAALAVHATGGNAFKQPTSTAALQVQASERAPLQSVARVGERLVAVGLRGIISYSDDNGQSWKQAQVPVDTDLVAVSFPSAEHGWAVGHQGVVLESTDQGASWAVRFSDMALVQLAIDSYQSQGEAGEAVARALQQAQFTLDGGAPYSLLDVYFETPESGYLIGSFNTIFHTSDGGKTWVPQMERTNNPNELHFYALRGDARGLYLCGERGMVWRLDAAKQQWQAVPTGYSGTLFGLQADGQQVLAYGMRGSIYRSEDGGAHWKAIDTPQKAGILSGIQLKDGSLVLANQAGAYLKSSDGGRSFSTVASEQPSLAFALNQSASGQLIAAGPFGVAPITLK